MHCSVANRKAVMRQQCKGRAAVMHTYRGHDDVAVLRLRGDLLGLNGVHPGHPLPTVSVIHKVIHLRPKSKAGSVVRGIVTHDFGGVEQDLNKALR